MRIWWSHLRLRQRWGGALAVTGVVFTVLLALLGSRSSPPAASTQALLALLAILAQAGSAWVFSGDGKADPGLARRSVSRLVGLARHANEARLTAQTLKENSPTVAEFRHEIGPLSVHLSYLEEGLIEAVEDWRVFHPDAVARVESQEETND